MMSDYSRDDLFIGGRWLPPASGDSLMLLEAATGKPLGAAPLGGLRDVDSAVQAARAAFDSGPWPCLTLVERAQVLRRFAEELSVRGDATAELISRENGRR